MKTISAGMRTHLSTGETRLCTCWQITRTDGQVLRFTDHDKALAISTPSEVAGTYSVAIGYTGSTVQSGADMSVDNLDVAAILDDDSISEGDLRAGLYDGADVYIFAVNWSDLSLGVIKLRRGTLGEVEFKDGQGLVELRGLTQELQQTLGRTYGATCDADLGDSRCAVNLAAHTVTGTVTSVAGGRYFTDSGRAEADGFFSNGKLTWTSGNNNGRAVEIRSFASDQFEMFTPMPEAVQIGDTYSVYRGCDKLRGTCKTVFSNLDNFRGYPFIPGIDKAMETPG